MKINFNIIIEKSKTGYAAYTPELNGVVATGPTKEIVLKNMKEALEFHIEGMQSEGLQFPKIETEIKKLAINF